MAQTAVVTPSKTEDHVKYLPRKAALQNLISDETQFVNKVDFEIIDIVHPTKQRPINQFVLVKIMGTKGGIPSKEQKLQVVKKLLNRFEQQEYTGRYIRSNERSFYVRITELCNYDIPTAKEVNPKLSLLNVAYSSTQSSFQKNYQKLCDIHKRFPLYGVPNRDQVEIEDGFACFNYFDEKTMYRALNFFLKLGIECSLRPQKKNNLIFMLQVSEEVWECKMLQEDWQDNHLEKVLGYDNTYVFGLIRWILTKVLRMDAKQIVEEGRPTQFGMSTLYKINVLHEGQKKLIVEAFKNSNIAFVHHGDAGYRKNFTFFVPLSQLARSIYAYHGGNIAMPFFTKELKNPDSKNKYLNNSHTQTTKTETQMVTKKVEKTQQKNTQPNGISSEEERKLYGRDVVFGSIDKIKIKIFVREKGLNEDRVNMFTELYKAGAFVEPIAVKSDNELIYGRHRIQARINAGYSYIPMIYKADVKTNADTIMAALDENIDPKASLAATESDVVFACMQLIDENMSRKVIISYLSKKYPIEYVQKMYNAAALRVNKRQMRLAQHAVADQDITIKAAALEFGVEESTLRTLIKGEKTTQNLGNMQFSRMANLSKTLGHFSRGIGQTFGKVLEDVAEGVISPKNGEEYFKAAEVHFKKIMRNFKEKQNRLEQLISKADRKS